MRILISLLLSVFLLGVSFESNAYISYQKPRNFLMSFKEFKKLSRDNQKATLVKIMEFLAKKDSASRAQYAELSGLEQLIPSLIDEAQAADGSDIPKQCIFAGWIINAKPGRNPPQCPKSEFGDVTMAGKNYGNVWCSIASNTVKCNSQFFGTCGDGADTGHCAGTAEDGSCCVKAAQGATRACVNFGTANADKIANCMLKGEDAQKRWDDLNASIANFCTDLRDGMKAKKYSSGKHVAHNDPDCTDLENYASLIKSKKGTTTQPTQLVDLEKACNDPASGYEAVCSGYDKVEDCNNTFTTYSAPITEMKDKNGVVKEQKLDVRNGTVILKAMGNDSVGHPAGDIPLSKANIALRRKNRMDPIHWAMTPKADFKHNELGRVGDDSTRSISAADGRVDETHARRFLGKLDVTQGMQEAVMGNMRRCKDRSTTGEGKKLDTKESWQYMRLANGPRTSLPFRMSTGGNLTGANPAEANCGEGELGACASSFFVCSRVKMEDGKTVIKEFADYFVTYSKKAIGNTPETVEPGALEMLETGTFSPGQGKESLKVPVARSLFAPGDESPTFEMGGPLEFRDTTIYRTTTEYHCPQNSRRISQMAPSKPFNKVMVKYEPGSATGKRKIADIAVCHAGADKKYEGWIRWPDGKGEDVKPGRNELELTTVQGDAPDAPIDLAFDTTKPADTPCEWAYEGEKGAHLYIDRDSQVQKKTIKAPSRESAVK